MDLMPGFDLAKHYKKTIENSLNQVNIHLKIIQQIAVICFDQLLFTYWH